MPDPYKAFGRKQAGTWGKPHRENRTAANQAARALMHREDGEHLRSSGPYQLRVIWKRGREDVITRGHDPTLVRSAESRVARNTQDISKIILCDQEGVIETIWDSCWEDEDV